MSHDETRTTKHGQRRSASTLALGCGLILLWATPALAQSADWAADEGITTRAGEAGALQGGIMRFEVRTRCTDKERVFERFEPPAPR